MLAFLQHPYMLLAAKAMMFWTSLLSSSERAAGRAEPLTPETTPIPLDCVAALMDLAGIFFTQFITHFTTTFFGVVDRKQSNGSAYTHDVSKCHDMLNHVATACQTCDGERESWHATGEHLQKGVHLVEADTELPPFFDTFEDFKEFCYEYRSNLGKIVRLCACLLPEPALMSAHRRLSAAIQLCSTSESASQVG